MTEPIEQSGARPSHFSQDKAEKAIEQSPSRALDYVTSVGAMKPLGYVPESAIQQYHPGGLNAFTVETQAKGLKVGILPPNIIIHDEDEIVGTVAQFVNRQEESNFEEATHPEASPDRHVYVYDEEVLRKLLEERKEDLAKAGWPTEPDKFVIAVDLVSAPPQTVVFDTVADAFGDKELVQN